MDKMFVFKIIVDGKERDTFVYAETEKEATERLIGNFTHDKPQIVTVTKVDVD